MARPRLALDEHAVLQSYREGHSLARIASEHDVDRSVITRIVDEAALRHDSDGNVMRFPYTPPEPPAGCVTAMGLIQRTGITYRQMDYWTRTGLLRPLPRVRATSGHPNYYPTAQVHRAATLSWLLNAGLSLQTCRAVIDDLLATGHARLAEGLVIHLPEDS